MGKDPVCGMNVDEKPPNSSLNTWIKPTTSATNHAKPRLTRPQQGILAGALAINIAPVPARHCLFRFQSSSLALSGRENDVLNKKVFRKSAYKLHFLIYHYFRNAHDSILKG